MSSFHFSIRQKWLPCVVTGIGSGEIVLIVEDIRRGSPETEAIWCEGLLWIIAVDQTERRALLIGHVWVWPASSNE